MIWIIVTLAVALRLIGVNQSLWLDEGINVNVASALNLKSLILNYSLSDFHPPLFHAILRGWILTFGSSEVAVRIPSVIFGSATVFLIYLIGKKLFEEKTALVAATLLATAPLHIYYSQEARMYALAALLATLSVYFFVSLLKKDSFWGWFGFITSTTLMLYSDYLPYLLIPAYFLYLVVFKKRVGKSFIRAFIPALILIFISVSPWLLVFPSQFQTGLSTAAASPAWAQIVGSTEIKNFFLTFVKFTIGRVSSDNNLFYALSFIPAGVFVIFLFLLSFFRLSAQRAFLHFWFFAPILLAYLASFYVPIFAYFRLLFVLPAFYLIWASAINTLNWVFPTRTLLAVALAINLTSATIYFTNQKFHREDWRQATRFVQSQATAKSLVLFDSDYTVGPFDYYNKQKVKAEGALYGVGLNKNKLIERLENLTASSDRIFLFQYLSPITDREGLVFEQLTRLGFTNTTTRDFNGVGFVYVFER